MPALSPDVRFLLQYNLCHFSLQNINILSFTHTTDLVCGRVAGTTFCSSISTNKGKKERNTLLIQCSYSFWKEREREKGKAFDWLQLKKLSIFHEWKSSLSSWCWSLPQTEVISIPETQSPIRSQQILIFQNNPTDMTPSTFVSSQDKDFSH